MKKIASFVFVLFFVLLMTSCVETSFIQVFTAQPVGNVGNEKNVVVFSDDNCVVSYNLWDSKAAMSFLFHNKTDHNLYINLLETCFVINGQAYDYFNTEQKVEVSQSETFVSPYFSSVSTTRTTYKNDMRSYIVCVPPQTSRYINSNFVVTDVVYRDCYLIYDPNMAGRSVLVNNRYRPIDGGTIENFSKDNSPFVFKNVIAYSKYADEGKEFSRIETPFYISKISNYLEDAVVKKRKKETIICDEKSDKDEKYFIDYSANKFYLRYFKDDKKGYVIETYAGH